MSGALLNNSTVQATIYAHRYGNAADGATARPSRGEHGGLRRKGDEARRWRRGLLPGPLKAEGHSGIPPYVRLVGHGLIPKAEEGAKDDA